jgi:hypothetical protein
MYKYSKTIFYLEHLARTLSKLSGIKWYIVGSIDIKIFVVFSILTIEKFVNNGFTIFIYIHNYKRIFF